MPRNKRLFSRLDPAIVLNEVPRTWSTASSIATLCGASKNAVARHLACLEKAGRVEVCRWINPRRKEESILYYRLKKKV